MTAKELLKPRFEVIAEYPNSIQRIGTVLTQEITDHFSLVKDGKSFTTNIKNIDEYPHIYRKLNWWERRKIEDMPKKLICKAIEGDTEVQEIEEWDMSILVGWTNKAKRECCSLLSFNPEYGYFPID